MKKLLIVTLLLSINAFAKFYTIENSILDSIVRQDSLNRSILGINQQTSLVLMYATSRSVDSKAVLIIYEMKLNNRAICKRFENTTKCRVKKEDGLNI